MWELDYEESWVQKNRCFWTVVLEKILESPLDCKEIKPVHPKGNQFWIFIGRIDAEASILWPPEELTHLKRPWCWERLKAGREGVDRGWDGWMASPNQWTWVWVSPGVGDGQGGLACCSPWGSKESDKTKRLNWTDEPVVLLLGIYISGEKYGSKLYMHPSVHCSTVYNSQDMETT